MGAESSSTGLRSRHAWLTDEQLETLRGLAGGGEAVPLSMGKAAAAGANGGKEAGECLLFVATPGVDFGELLGKYVGENGRSQRGGREAGNVSAKSTSARQRAQTRTRGKRAKGTQGEASAASFERAEPSRPPLTPLASLPLARAGTWGGARAGSRLTLARAGLSGRRRSCAAGCSA